MPQGDICPAVARRCRQPDFKAPHRLFGVTFTAYQRRRKQKHRNQRTVSPCLIQNAGTHATLRLANVLGQGDLQALCEFIESQL